MSSHFSSRYRITDDSPSSYVGDRDAQEAFTELLVDGHALHSPNDVVGASRTAAHGLAHLARSVDSDYALNSPEQAAAVLDAAHDITVALERLVQGTGRWLAASGDRGEVDEVSEEVFDRLHAVGAALKSVPALLEKAGAGVRDTTGHRAGVGDLRAQAAEVAKLLKRRDATLVLEHAQDEDDMLWIWQIQFTLPGDARVFEVVLSEEGDGALPLTMDFATHPGAIVEWVLSRIDDFVLQEAPQRVEKLSADEAVLLGHVLEAGRPVQVSDFFESMNTASGMAATERQVELFRLYTTLWQRALLRVVVEANGRDGDKVMLTGTGEASLKAARR